MRAEFSLPVYGRFTTAEVHNCDFQVDALEFSCPTDGDKAEKWALDHRYFRALTEPAEIYDELILDFHRGPRIGVEVDCKRICPSRLGLGGTGTR